VWKYSHLLFVAACSQNFWMYRGSSPVDSPSVGVAYSFINPVEINESLVIR